MTFGGGETGVTPQLNDRIRLNTTKGLNHQSERVCFGKYQENEND